MEIIPPLLLYSAAVEIVKTHHLIEAAAESFPPGSLVTPDDCGVVGNLMHHLHGDLLKLNCPVAAMAATKPATLMQAESLTYGLLKSVLEEIDGRLRDEIQTTYAFSLNHAEAILFDPAKPLLGDNVALKFESASFDIVEAGKCHALGRSTVAVFHAFRVLEVGIKAIAKFLDIPDLEKPRMRNWGTILGEIEKRLKVLWPDEKSRDQGDGELFERLYLLLTALKNPRNGTMHPARKYTEQEADIILRLVGEIMTALAERVDESGEPKSPTLSLLGGQ